MDAPSTEELDGVALYIITARELKSCRFFVEEHHQLSISFRHGDPPEAVQGRFPDPDTVSAALIPFRKLWMKGEPCFYRHVANTIKMHCEDLRWLVDFSFCLNSDAPRMVPFLRDVELSTEDVVDMWLNTRYMHVGKARRKGRFSREDFARWERDIGPTLFEYYFLSSIYGMGLLFFNIVRDAEAFLRWCQSQGWEPGIDTSAAEANPDVTRSTPGFGQSGGPQEQMTWRLRRRKKYAGFSAFLEGIHVSDAQIGHHVAECECFLGFCERIGVALEEHPSISDLDGDEVVFNSGALDDHATVIRSGRVRKGMFFLCRSRTVKWDGDWLEVVSEQYEAFRAALCGS